MQTGNLFLDAHLIGRQSFASLFGDVERISVSGMGTACLQTKSIAQRARYHASFLGTFHCSTPSESAVRINSERLQSLFAYLALHVQAPLRRDLVASALWPDIGEREARTRLRKAIHDLNNALAPGGNLLDSTHSTISWQPEILWQTDVARFRHALDPDRAHV